MGEVTSESPVTEVNQEAHDLTSTADYAYQYEYIYLGNPGHLGVFLEALVYITGITGFATNLFVLTILCCSKKFREKPTNLLLINQTFIDLFVSVLLLVTYVPWFAGASSRVKDNFWGRFYCHLINDEVIMYIGFYANTFNIAFMAGERLLMIAFPLVHLTALTTNKVLVVIIIGWIVSTLLNIPAALSAGIYGTSCTYGYILNSAKFNMAHGYVIMTLTYFLPISFVVYCYIHMTILLKRPKHSGKVQPIEQPNNTPGVQRKALSSSQVNLLKILAAITVIYIITWSPIQVYYFMYNLGMPLSFADAYYYIGTSMAILNSTINPFIYIFKYREFRVTLRKVLKLQPAPGSSTYNTSRDNSALQLGRLSNIQQSPTENTQS